MNNTNGGNGEDMPKDENSPAVLAYRVGQLEKASREGFKDLSNKIELLSNNFATHKDVEMAKNQAEAEHKAIYTKISEIERDVSMLKKRTWIQNTLSAILGAVLTILLAYTINGILK